jgi:hypothetical protein
MPQLNNPRHEAFAQHRYEGYTCDEAYERAGYKPNRHNAARLDRTEHIRTRVHELQERSARKHDINVDSLTERYYEVMALAQAKGDTSTMKAALDSLAKLHGVWVDRSETKDVTDQHVKAIEDLARAKRDRLQVVEGKAKAG